MTATAKVSVLACLLFSIVPTPSVNALGKREDVTVELSTSQERIELGQTWELFATVTNLTDKPIWISDMYSLLVLPAAVRPQMDLMVASQGGTLAEPAVNENGADYLRIEPQEQGYVFWRISWSREETKAERARSVQKRDLSKIQSSDGATSANSSSEDSTPETSADASVGSDPNQSTGGADAGTSEWRSILGDAVDIARSFFHQAFVIQPGKYHARVEIHYWVSDPTLEGTPQEKKITNDASLTALLRSLVAASPGKHLLPSARTIVASKELDVSHSPFVSIVGGGAGGLLGFFILFLSQQTADPKAEDAIRSLRERLRKIFYYGSHATLAVLLGITITILLSRIGDTKFLISVKINDIWGALTTGLIAELAGFKILERVLGLEVRRNLGGAEDRSAVAGSDPRGATA